MMKLSCKDINPNTTCDFETTGDTAKEVSAKMMDHAKINHSADIEGMSDDDMMKTFEQKVHM